MRAMVLAALAAALAASASQARAETVHHRGAVTLKLEGIHLPAQKPNQYGPYTGTLVDFDRPGKLNKNSPAVDVEVGVAVRESTFSFSTPDPRRIAVAGTRPPSYSQCLQLLAASTHSDGPPIKAPSVYHCARTDQGRAVRFRLLSAQKIAQDNFFIDMYVKIASRVWNP